MNKIIKKMVIAIITLCVGVSLAQMPVNASETKNKGAAKVKSVSMKLVGGGDFVRGESVVKVSFKVSAKSKVTVNIVNNSGRVVYKKSYSSCKGGRTYSFNWNGKNSKGRYVKTDMYSAKVVVGKNSKKSSSIRFYAKNDFAGGNGSKAKPYLVANATQFSKLNAHNGKYFKQIGNIDFSTTTFVPRFPEDNPFKGTYDGNGKTISNIMYSTDELWNIGLFGVIDKTGTVKNVILKDSSFRARSMVGGIAGVNNGKILNCQAIGVSVTMFANNSGAGAIVGNNYLLVQGCVVKDSAVSGVFESGIVVGVNEATVRNCKTYSSAVNSWRSGGIVGYNSSLIDNCYMNYCEVHSPSGVNCKAGGIASSNYGTIKNCTASYKDGQITSYMWAGGISGEESGTSLNNINNGSLHDKGNH